MNNSSNKIKVLHIAPNFNYSCGVSRHIYYLLKNYKNINDYELHFITNGGDSVERLRELNINYEIIEFDSGIKNIFYAAKNYFEIRKYCKSNSIDIIHTHHRYPELIAVLVSKSLKIKTISTVHSFVSNNKIISFKSDKIIAVSKYIRNLLINQFNVENNKIVVFYNFLEKHENLNFDRIQQIKNKYEIEEFTKVLLFVGRISKIKGIDILLRVFNNLKKDYPFAKLLLVGEICDEQIMKYIKNSRDNISIISPQKDIENYYYISDIVVLPSRMDPFPYVMLESGLAKKALIGSNVGGIPEYIVNNENGLLIENENDLYDKIITLLNNVELIKKLSENNYKSAKVFTDSAVYIDKISTLYKDLIYDKR